jgi:hypothetical protein
LPLLSSFLAPGAQNTLCHPRITSLAVHASFSQPPAKKELKKPKYYYW